MTKLLKQKIYNTSAIVILIDMILDDALDIYSEECIPSRVIGYIAGTIIGVTGVYEIITGVIEFERNKSKDNS